MSNTRLKLAKKQAKAEQHLEAELFVYENFSLSSSTLSSIGDILKKCTKNKYIYSNKVL